MVHEIVQWVLAAEKDIYVYPISKEINLHDNNMDMPWSQGSDGMSAPIEIWDRGGEAAKRPHACLAARRRTTNQPHAHASRNCDLLHCMHALAGSQASLAYSTHANVSEPELLALAARILQGQEHSSSYRTQHGFSQISLFSHSRA